MDVSYHDHMEEDEYIAKEDTESVIADVQMEQLPKQDTKSDLTQFQPELPFATNAANDHKESLMYSIGLNDSVPAGHVSGGLDSIPILAIDLNNALSIHSGRKTQKQKRPLNAYDKLLPDDGEGLDSGGERSYNNKMQDSLIDEKPGGLHKHPDSFKDLPFSGLFILAQVAMIITGLVYWIISKTSGLSQLGREVRNNIYFGFSESYGQILTTLAISFGLGFLWIYLLSRYLRKALWATIFLIPAAFFAVTIFSLKSAFDGGRFESEGKWLIPESIISFMLGIISSVLVHKKRTNISRSIALVELSFQIIKDNAGIIFISLRILISYFIFCVVWLALFCSLMLIGHIEKNANERTWIPDPSSPVVIAFFVFMFMWTSVTFSYVERCMISGVVCEWYFHRNDPVRTIAKKDLAKESLKRSLTYTFGSICFASLVLSAIQAIRLSIHTVRKIGRWVVSDTISDLFGSCAEMIEGLVDGVNSFALVYIAFNGTDFCTAAQKCAFLFRRNLISAVLFDNITRMLLLFGVYAVSLICFLGTFNFAVDVSGSSYSWFIALIGSLLPFYMLRFCSFILLQVMDAVFVCYVVDLDSNQVNSQLAHAALSGDEATIWNNHSVSV